MNDRSIFTVTREYIRPGDIILEFHAVPGDKDGQWIRECITVITSINNEGCILGVDQSGLLPDFFLPGSWVYVVWRI